VLAPLAGQQEADAARGGVLVVHEGAPRTLGFAQAAGGAAGAASEEVASIGWGSEIPAVFYST
jgi:hypothetical protein